MKSPQRNVGIFAVAYSGNLTGLVPRSGEMGLKTGPNLLLLGVNPRAPGHFPAPKASLMLPEGHSRAEAQGRHQAGLRAGKWTHHFMRPGENESISPFPEMPSSQARNGYFWPGRA